MSENELFINGDLLRLRREARGWVLSDMATRACMSVKQIRQLEEGGTSAFYSAAVKETAAKKVGALLGISVDEVFGQKVDADDTQVPHENDASLESVSAAVTEFVPLVEAAALEQPNNSVHADVPDVVKPKTSLWVIAGLFVAALAVAAYMQPKDEPIVEPAPPLQVVPAEVATDAASAPEVPASVASAASKAL